jgi:hypothetical protein
MAIVKVDIRDDEQSTNLASALSARMAHSEIPSKQQVIFEPSDVVTFQLVATRHASILFPDSGSAEEAIPVSEVYIS